MSYELGAVRRPTRRPNGRLRGNYSKHERGRMRRAKVLMDSRYGVVPAELGFSLKPGRRLRKLASAVKRNVTLKRALIGGAIVGAAFIPGVAPAAMSVVRGAGGVVRGTARLVGRGAGSVVGLFRKSPSEPSDYERAGFPEPGKPGGNILTTLFTPPTPASTPPIQAGPASPTPGPAMDQSAGAMQPSSGGGSGAPAGLDTPGGGADAAAPAPQQAGINPLVILGGLALAGVALKRRKAS